MDGIERSHEQNASGIGVARRSTKDPRCTGNRAFVAHCCSRKLATKGRITNDNIKAAVFRPRVIQRVANDKNEGKFLLLCRDAMRTGPTNKFSAGNFKCVRINVHTAQTCECIEWSSAGCNQCIGSRK